MLKRIEIDCGLLDSINWSEVRERYSQLCDLARTESITDIYSEAAYGSRIFCIDGGAIIETTIGDPDTFYLWAGGGLEASLSQCSIMRDRLSNSKLNFVNFNFFSMTSSLLTHVDGKTDAERNIGHCNLNFVVSSSDLEASIYFEHDHGITWAKTTPNTLWLIDTDIPHGVKNSGLREVFQLMFHSPYSEVLEWLENHPDFLCLP